MIPMRTEIKEFAEKMETVMASHDKEKGDSWKTMPISKLNSLLGDEIDEWVISNESEEEDELIDIAVITMMIWNRKQKKE